MARVLVVEDNASALTLLRDFLLELGFTVDTAADGTTAAELLAANAYDAALLDLNLPGKNGVELFALTRKLEDPPEVIFVTGNESLRNATTLLREGACDYLVKPFDNAQLEKALRSALRQRELLAKKDVLVRTLLRRNKQLEEAKGEREKLVTELQRQLEAAHAALTATPPPPTAPAPPTAPEPNLVERVADLQRLLIEKEQALRDLAARPAPAPPAPVAAPPPPSAATPVASPEDLSTAEAKLAYLRAAAGFLHPTRGLALATAACVALAFVAVCLVVLGGRGLPAAPGTAELRTALTGQGLIAALTGLMGALAVRLHCILWYARRAGTATPLEDHIPLKERILRSAAGVAGGLSGLAILAAAGLVAHGAAAAPVQQQGGWLLRYLSAASDRDAVSLALFGAAVAAFGAVTALALLVPRTLLPALEDTVAGAASRARLARF